MGSFTPNLTYILSFCHHFSKKMGNLKFLIIFPNTWLDIWVWVWFDLEIGKHEVWSSLCQSHIISAELCDWMENRWTEVRVNLRCTRACHGLVGSFLNLTLITRCGFSGALWQLTSWRGFLKCLVPMLGTSRFPLSHFRAFNKQKHKVDDLMSSFPLTF